MRYVVDTNIWIAIIRKNQKVRTYLHAALADRHEICITPIVYYELMRGFELHRQRYIADIAFIQKLWATLSYRETTKSIWDEAIRLWVVARRQNKNPGDRDILIAAFAIQLN